MIVTKILRLMVYELPFLLRTLIIFIGFGIVALELKVVQEQSRQYAQINNEKALVMRIPEMEKTIRAHTIRVMAVEAEHPNPQPQVQIAKIEFDLQGTSIKDGVPYALIDERIYKEGDMLGDYTVTEITRGSVKLENPLTKETKNLLLPQPENHFLPH